MSPTRRLLRYLTVYRIAFLRGLLCVVITTAISLSAPWILKFAIDDLTRSVTIAKIRWYAAALLALAAAGGLFRFLTRRIIIGASRDFEYDLRNELFAHLQRLDLGYFQRNRTGDLMSRATNDLNAVRMMIGPAVMHSATTVLTFIVAIALMLSIDARLTLIALIPLPLVSLFVRYFGAAIHHRFEKIQEELSDISAVTQEALAGVRVVRAYCQESFEIDRFRRANERYVHRNREMITLQGIYFPSLMALIGIGALLVLWLGSREVIALRMSLGELVALDTYLMMLGGPMIAFGWVTNLLQRGLASWKRILDVLDTRSSIVNSEASRIGLSPSGIRGNIEISQSIHTRTTMIPTSVKASPKTDTTPDVNSSLSTSTSVVTRVIRRPTGLRS
jgi:ATP-binding cassette subfamily B multidrug efflux pump